MKDDGKKSTQNEDFSLEEIIAEVKSGGSPKKRPAADIVMQSFEIPKPEEVIERVKREHTESKSKVIDIEEAIEKRRKERGGQPKSETPWRTPVPPPVKQPIAELEPEPEEYYYDEDEYEEDRERRFVPYDFINKRYSDAALGGVKCGKRAAGLKIKMWLASVPMLLSIAVTFLDGFGVNLPTGYSFAEIPFYYVAALCAMHAVAILLSLDVLLPGLFRLIRLRPTMDTLVFFATFCIMAHTAWMLIGGHWESGLPFSAVGILLCYSGMRAKWHKAQMLKRTYKASQMATSPVAVKAVETVDGYVAVKTQDSAFIEVEQVARADSAERTSQVFAPLALMVVVALAVTSSYGMGSRVSIIWSLAAISSVCVSNTFLLAYASPADKLSKKLFASGAAIINSKTGKKIARCKRALLHDGDIFPVGSVTITGMKIADNQKVDRVISYAAAIMQHCGSGVTKAFFDLAHSQYVGIREADAIEFYGSSGASAQIGSDRVVMGNEAFLMKMGIPVTVGGNVKNGIYIAVNSKCAGVFTIRYGVQPQAYVSFKILRHVKVIPMLALKNFNMPASTVEERFGLRSGWAEFLKQNDRIMLGGLNEEISGEMPLATLARDSMSSFSETVAAAKKLSTGSRMNIACGVASSVLGIVIMYFLAVAANFSAASAFNTLLYALLWVLPMWASNILNTKY